MGITLVKARRRLEPGGEMDGADEHAHHLRLRQIVGMADRGIDRPAAVGADIVGEHRLRRLPRHLTDGEDARLRRGWRNKIKRASLLNRSVGGNAREERIPGGVRGDFHRRSQLIAEVAGVLDAEHIAIKLPPCLAAVDRLLRLPGVARRPDPDHRFSCGEKRLERGHLRRAEPPPAG